MLVNRFSVQLNDKFTFAFLAFLAFSTNIEPNINVVRFWCNLILLLLFGERCRFHWLLRFQISIHHRSFHSNEIIIQNFYEIVCVQWLHTAH